MLLPVHALHWASTGNWLEKGLNENPTQSKLLCFAKVWIYCSLISKYICRFSVLPITCLNLMTWLQLKDCGSSDSGGFSPVSPEAYQLHRCCINTKNYSNVINQDWFSFGLVCMTVNCERLLLSSNSSVWPGSLKKVFWQTIRLEMKVPVRRSSGDDYTVKPHCTNWSKSYNWGWGFSSVFIIWASKPNVNAEYTPLQTDRLKSYIT